MRVESSWCTIFPPNHFTRNPTLQVVMGRLSVFGRKSVSPIKSAGWHYLLMSHSDDALLSPPQWPQAVASPTWMTLQICCQVTAPPPPLQGWSCYLVSDGSVQCSRQRDAVRFWQCKPASRSFSTVLSPCGKVRMFYCSLCHLLNFFKLYWPTMLVKEIYCLFMYICLIIFHEWFRIFNII